MITRKTVRLAGLLRILCKVGILQAKVTRCGEKLEQFMMEIGKMIIVMAMVSTVS